MVKSADTADLKSADLNRSWGFKSPSGHQKYVTSIDFSKTQTLDGIIRKSTPIFCAITEGFSGSGTVSVQQALYMTQRTHDVAEKQKLLGRIST